MQIFEIFEFSGQKLSNSSSQSWIDKVSSSSNFALFFIVMTHNSTLNFELIHFLLWIKGSCQSPNFESFACSGKNIFLMSFSKQQAIFSSNFASHFSVMKESSNIIHFGQKEPIKLHIFETSECLGQNLSISSCQFWNNNSIVLQIFYHSSLSWQITPL